MFPQTFFIVNRNKSIFIYIVNLCLAGFIQAQECEVLKVGGRAAWVPIAFVEDGTQEIRGIAHDFVREIGKQLNHPVDINPSLPWALLTQDLASG